MSIELDGVFGESYANTVNSQYTFANVVTLAMMDELFKDDCFAGITQADVLNFALVLLKNHFRTNKNEDITKMLHRFVDDTEELKEFALYTMDSCRETNDKYNKQMLDELKREGRA